MFIPTLPELESLVKIAAIIIGGWWAYRKFIRQREAHPKIEFQLDVRPLGRQSGRLLVELSASMKNAGAVRHKTPQFTLEVRYLLSSDTVQSGDSSINYQTVFPHSTNHELKLEKRSFVPWRPFVEPGVTQVFTYVTDVPDASAYVLLLSKFSYDDEWCTTHTAQRVVHVGDEKGG